MELIESLKYSFEKQSREQGKTLLPSSNRSYIDKSLWWSMSIEGFLFWAILHNSYYCHGIYDYITITKLYNRYGRDVFKYDISMLVYYRDYFDINRNCLSDDGFEKLCKCLESYGAIRKS